MLIINQNRVRKKKKRSWNSILQKQVSIKEIKYVLSSN